MRKGGDEGAELREMILGESLRSVASELRMIDIGDLATYIYTLQFANLADLVDSAVELYYRPGVFRFAKGGGVDVKWGAPPTVSLDLEFRNRAVQAYFRLVLDASSAGVEIDYVAFDDDPGEAEEGTRRLAEALIDARIPAAGTAHKPQASSHA